MMLESSWYALGFIVGLLLVTNAAVVWFLLRRITVQDRRLVELEALQDDWEPAEPDYVSALQVWRASTARHHAEQMAAEAEQEEEA